MVLGFNHNFQYKGEVFHVQTEDSGVANPHIITILYRGGVILCSQKTSYSDILKIENLSAVVEDLMKEQHKNMMRRLKSGEFDDKAFSIKPQLLENYKLPTLEPESDLPDSRNVSSPIAADITNGNTSKSPEDHSPARDGNSAAAPAEQSSGTAPTALDMAVSTFFDTN